MFLLENVGKKYVVGTNEKWALRGISLSFPSCGLVAIKGHSGSGKSTMLNLLSMLEKPTTGTIFFKGQDLSKLNNRQVEDFRAYECSFVYQHFNLYESLTALENIALPLEVRGVGKKEAAQKASALLKEYGMEALSGKKAQVLSGGEKQRVAILRAIIGEPSFILADEPTGALDSDNEQLVMETLKRISRNRLVILVSHNGRIIKEYADYLIELSEGKLMSAPNLPPPKKEKLRKAKRKSPSWLSTLLEKNFRRDGYKNALSVVAGAIGYCALLLCFGFFSGSRDILEGEAKRSLLYTQGSISKITEYAIEGSPLSLTQSGRPLFHEAEDLFPEADYAVKNDYSYFLPGYESYTLDGESQKNVYFSPLQDLTLHGKENLFSYEGELPSEDNFSQCLVNSEFANQFSESPVGKTIKMSREVEIEMGETLESVLFEATFLIKAVVEEFSFLNSARVYYSHEGLEKYLKTLQFPIISAESGRDLTAFEVVDEAEGNSPYSAYSYLIFAKDEEEIEKISAASEKWTEEDEYSFYSEALTIGDSFSDLTNAFSSSLIPFLALAIGSFCFVLGALILSSFIEKKKEAAILLALGSRRGEVNSLYRYEAIICSFLAALLSIILSYPLSHLFNLYLKGETGLANLIQIPYFSYLNIPLFPILAIVLIALLIGYLASSIPLFFAGKVPLSEELRDE